MKKLLSSKAKRISSAKVNPFFSVKSVNISTKTSSMGSINKDKFFSELNINKEMKSEIEQFYFSNPVVFNKVPQENENKNINEKEKIDEKTDEKKANNNDNENNNGNKNDDNDKNKKDDNNKNNKNDKNYNDHIANFCLLISLSSFVYVIKSRHLTQEIDNIEFLNKVKDGEIKIIKINKASHDSPFFKAKSDLLSQFKDLKEYVTLITNTQQFVNAINKLEISIQRQEADKVKITINENEIDYSQSMLIPLFFLAIGLMLKRKNGIKPSSNMNFDTNKKGSIFDSFNPTKDNIQDFSKDEKPKVKFNEVAGMNSAKREITEFVDFLKNSEKYTKLGAKIPKGALLVGPPGTGKTLLAKATAGEAGVPFYSMSGSEFIEMFVGVGAGRVRKLFKKARENSPSIIFIDEIDAIGKSRKSSFQNDESDSTLNQLLVEMDGFGTESNVIVLAATNFAESLDPALTRPGRFDRKVEVLLPDINEREEILKIYLNKIVLSTEKTLDDYAKRLATLTPGFSGADLANVVNEAAIITARNNLPSVNSEAFEKANERVIAGMETKRPIDENTKKTIAIHESGHAICSWFLENASPLVKITIIPRSKGALGFNQFISDDRNLYSKEYILDQICTLLGGRIAEKELIGKVTTGASDDLKKITNLAYTMVTKLGMSDLGLQAFSDNNYVKPFSAEYEKVIFFKFRK